jgi:long-subunit fatty acid transport protein
MRNRPRATLRCLPLALGTAWAFGLLLPATAAAGGFEFPANGTEALGRGGAFTAKADTPLALEYNVAGLAGQRGTRLLFDSNLVFGHYAFQRAGDFRLVTDEAHKPYYGPFFGLTTDFGYFDRWTFAVGVFGPSSIGKRTYPIGEDRLGPARYDVTSTDTLLILPTVAASVRASRYVDVGLGMQFAVGTFKLGSSAAVPALCDPSKVFLDPACDSRTEVDVKSGVNPTLLFGLLLHPMAGIDVGLHVRSAANLGIKRIEAQGTLRAYNAVDVELGDGDATLTASLPWVFRLGARYAFRKAGREVGDIELDATYEAWSLAEGEGTTLMYEYPLNRSQIRNTLLPHRYKDTYSLRLGGAFTQPVGKLDLTFRLGFVVDSSATNPADTRLDFDTLTKVGGTAGAGLTFRGVTLNIAYAYLHSLTRTVEDGQLRALDGATGMPTGGPVNNGTYSGRNQILSLGLLVQFDELVKGDAWTRKPRLQ